MKSLQARPHRVHASQSGLSGCWLVAGACVLLVGLVGLVATRSYNGMVVSQERVQAQWSEINNQYKRRFDLVPQLVETVKGAADFERSRQVLDERGEELLAGVGGGALDDGAQRGLHVDVAQGGLIGPGHAPIVPH